MKNVINCYQFVTFSGQTARFAKRLRYYIYSIRNVRDHP